MITNKNNSKEKIVVQIITNQKKVITEERVINVARITKKVVLENKNFCCSVPIVVKKQSKILLPQ